MDVYEDTGLYEGMQGVEFEVLIMGIESLADVTEQKLHVIEPDGTRVTWTPTVDIGGGLFRYVCQEQLKAGEYLIQPSFRLGDFDGPWGEFSFIVARSQKQSFTVNP